MADPGCPRYRNPVTLGHNGAASELPLQADPG